ncbi:MAG: hypothetical protein WAM97_13170, partial [Acidimicrobiales bacterium]
MTSANGESMNVEISGKGLVEVPTGSTVADALGSRAFKGQKNAKDSIVAAFVDGVIMDLDAELKPDSTIEAVKASSEPGRAVLRHSTAHVMAQAVSRLWPGAHYAIGPVIEGGFYYDFELPGGAHFSDQDLDRIDEEMRSIIREDQPFDREEHDRLSGLALFSDQPFKVEIIETVA